MAAARVLGGSPLVDIPRPVFANGSAPHAIPQTPVELREAPAFARPVVQAGARPNSDEMTTITEAPLGSLAQPPEGASDNADDDFSDLDYNPARSMRRRKRLALGLVAAALVACVAAFVLKQAPRAYAPAANVASNDAHEIQPTHVADAEASTSLAHAVDSQSAPAQVVAKSAPAPVVTAPEQIAAKSAPLVVKAGSTVVVANSAPEQMAAKSAPAPEVAKSASEQLAAKSAPAPTPVIVKSAPAHVVATPAPAHPSKHARSSMIASHMATSSKVAITIVSATAPMAPSSVPAQVSSMTAPVTLAPVTATPAAAQVNTPVATDSVDSVVAKYQAVAKKLKQQPKSPATEDLWMRFRLIRINESIATQQTRHQALALLTAIDKAIR
jgi:hypothetical protein